MALLELLPKHLFTTRGWGLLAAGTASLLLAQIMGRRDLLALGILLIVLPLVSLAGVRVLKPKFQVFREFIPPTVETSSTATVRLAVARTGSSNASVIMEEQLPPRFGEPPAFRFPARSASGGTSRYEYHLRSGRRGQFKIGPVTAEFCDPFGLSLHRHTIDEGELLTVTPAAVELPATGLAGARGNDGVTATRIRANPSDDDVMTREYRHGDPMRRVHWAATAHHGELMVRQEESVTTPEATIIMDHRYSSFAIGPGSRFPAVHDDSFELLSSDSFEWAVTAAMSISAHLAERNYSLRFLDAAGNPAFHGSRSAPFPDAEEYSGSGGLQSIGESLAAIQLDGPRHPHGEGRRGDIRRNDAKGGEGKRGDGGNPDGGEAAFDDRLMDKLAAHRLRGPVLALLGTLGEAEARALAPAAGFGANAFALLVTEHPRSAQAAVDALRLGGWRALAVTPRTQLTAAWSAFDQGEIMAAAAAAMDVRRGAAVER
ncbi:DUF58 domain-containing protein [Arthrobacter cupressi]|uniref:DUF58 domain-containing protein n=1 Tax=Arthrobacter cupressi TaxID=1045773 RepID=A0A1G8IVQ5_9MICC|nr:DUF58 domain-containing protein [Arthrobacter cupressi]NYD79142.1 uncharacterized protein (DUF58 family) [Arthrobacter cupressi]SDI22946.1 Protein of unknown function DUF58 [Arthrobacter cupressi]